jgi:predicted ATPase
MVAGRVGQDDAIGSHSPTAPYVLSLAVDGRLSGYTAGIPAVRSLVEQPLRLHPRVTFLVGENGSGKSTLVEALAVASRLNPEGGGRAGRFSTRASHSKLHESLVLERAPIPPANGFFLRAESFFNLASAVETGGGALRFENVYEQPLHEQSHGESFLAVATERFGPWGLYILDEPEAALSLQGQLALMRRMHDLVRAECQFVVATHSPVLLGYPDAAIFELGEDGIAERAYEETEQYQLTRSFLEDRERFLHYLLSDEDEETPGGLEPP